jgi:P27 family predicted phage terminase small subunit
MPTLWRKDLMGARGTPKTPLEILKKRGSQLVKEREENALVHADVCTPEKPDLIQDNPFACQAWDGLIPELESLGVLARIDKYVLMRYCMLLAEIKEAEHIIKEKYQGRRTFPVKNHRGEITAVKEFPESKVLRRNSPLMQQIENSFGMNPSSRSEPRKALIDANAEAGAGEEVIDVEQFFND